VSAGCKCRSISVRRNVQIDGDRIIGNATADNGAVLRSSLFEKASVAASYMLSEMLLS